MQRWHIHQNPQTAVLPSAEHICVYPYRCLTSTDNKHIIHTDFLNLTEKQALAVAHNDPKSGVLGNKGTSFLLDHKVSYLPGTTGLSAFTRGQAQVAQTSTHAVVTARVVTAPASTESSLWRHCWCYQAPYCKWCQWRSQWIAVV